MSERSKDWIRQAERDLESAKEQMKTGFFEWACFIAQQSSEKAIKAVYQKLEAEAWGHSLTELLEELKQKVDVPNDLIDKAKQLDKFYIPARYPNGWVSGTPGDYITEGDAIDATNNSEEILRFCKDILAG